MSMQRIVVESGVIKAVINRVAYRDPNGNILVLDEGEEQPPGYTPFVPDANPSPTPEQLKAKLAGAVQEHMDAAARAAGYDDIKSAVTYADEPVVPKFQQEGQAFRAWRSLCWAACYAVMAQVEAGERDVPTADELIAEMPALEVPA